jgi:YegS/Rv2252/BmrU family lipid kinase
VNSVRTLEKRACIILNPHASRGVAHSTARDLVDAADSVGWTTELRTTTYPGHETILAAEAHAQGWPVIVAAGGDGTVHGVANALLRADSPSVLGHIPIGTGNDFAKSLNLKPRRLRDNVRRILTEGIIRQFDVGRVDDEFFINGMGVGFDAEVVRQSLNLRRLKGFFLYLVAVYRTFWRFRPPTLEVEAAEYAAEEPMTLLEINIGTTTGGGFKLTPNAEPDDGLFDVCVIRGVSTAQFLRWVPRVIKGTHVNLDPVTMFQTAAVKIRGVDGPLSLQLDGELRYPDDRTVHVELLPRRLAILCVA